LFTVYSNVGEEQMGDGVWRQRHLRLQRDGRRARLATVTFPCGSSMDGKWHRIALSIKGDSVTLISECGRQMTESLGRSEDAHVDLTGIIVVGSQLVDSVYFEVQHAH
ncbi:hypothetical protein JTE90_022562, partial [Oedothorax gibbosus]